MNTSQYIPHESIVPILVKHDDYPFFSGTGFFVIFEPFEKIYLVTAKHCLLDNNNEPFGLPEIKLNSNLNCSKAVPFVKYMIGHVLGDEHCEDIIAYEVGDLSQEDYHGLRKRALPLPNQEIANYILRQLSERQEKVRALGFPGVSKAIDYDSRSGQAMSRGIVGKIKSSTPDLRWTTVEDLNWTEGGIDGFSGSPIMALGPMVDETIKLIPIGVLCTGRADMFRFISINAITNMILESIIGKTK